MASPYRWVWIGHDHADAYLLTAAHHLARACWQPRTWPLPPASASATLYCAFAAEAYVNVALVRLLGPEEYGVVSKMPVRSKYFLVSKIGVREEWFEGGERLLVDLGELFTQRNKLVHAQPDIRVWHPDVSAPPEEPEKHLDLANVARWVSTTAEAALRLSRSHPELAEFGRVAGPIADMENMLLSFDALRDGDKLDQTVRRLLETLIRQEEDEEPEVIDEMVKMHDPDWDLEALPDDGPEAGRVSN